MRKNQQDISTSLDNLFDHGENALPLSHLSSTNYIPIPISLPVTAKMTTNVTVPLPPPASISITDTITNTKNAPSPISSTLPPLDPVPPQWTRIGELLKQLKELHHIAALLHALPRLTEPGQG